MKRLALCAVAVLLTSGAFMIKPAYACTTDPACTSNDECPVGKKCNICTGRCA